MHLRQPVARLRRAGSPQPLRTQINQFSKSVTELFKLVKRLDKVGRKEQIFRARDVVATAHTVEGSATGRRGVRFSCPRIP
jgi:hypothetical protein